MCFFTRLWGHMCGCMICWLMWLSILFPLLYLASVSAGKNLQEITKLLFERWRFSATAQGVIRPAVAIAGSSDEPRGTSPFRDSISEWNGPFYLHHFTWSKPFFLRNAAKARIKNFWQQHCNNHWKIYKSPEGAEVCFLSIMKLGFFFLAPWGAPPPHLAVVAGYVFHYVLSSFHAGPWITAHFEKIDIECQTFQALEKCIIWPPVSQVWRWLWPMWLWRVSDREGLSWKPWAFFDVQGIQMPPRHRILRPDEPSPWLEWCSSLEEQWNVFFMTENGHSVPTSLFSHLCVSLSFTADCL